MNAALRAADFALSSLIAFATAVAAKGVRHLTDEVRAAEGRFKLGEINARSVVAQMSPPHSCEHAH